MSEEVAKEIIFIINLISLVSLFLLIISFIVITSYSIHYTKLYECGVGEGKSRKIAEQNAAKEALKNYN